MSWDVIFEAQMTLTAGAGALQQSRREDWDFGFLDDVLSRCCSAVGATSALIAARGDNGLLEVVGRFSVEWSGLEQPRFLDNLPANELDKDAFFGLGHILIQRDSCPLLLRALGGRRASTALLLPLFYCLSDANRANSDRVNDGQVAKGDGLMCFFFEESVRLADMTARVSSPSNLSRLEFLKKLAQAVGVACAAAFREIGHCLCCRTAHRRKRQRASMSAGIGAMQEDVAMSKPSIRIGQLDKLSGRPISKPLRLHPGASGTERLLEYSECLHALHTIVNDANWSQLSLADKIGKILRLGVITFGMTRGVVCKIVGNDVIFRHVYLSPEEKAASTPMFHVGLKARLLQTYLQYVQESNGPVGFYHAGSNATLSSKICYTMLEIESWIGTKIMVDGEQYGQMCFASVEPKRPLDERDLELARVLAQTVGNEMARARSRRLLEEQRNKADLANSTKTAFMSVLSHEIRTPMNGVVGMAQLLALSQLNRDQHECVETILASATSLLTIINDLLDVNKAEAGKMTVVAQPMNLAEMIKSTLDTVAPLCMPKGIQLVTSVSKDVPDVVQSDSVRVKQILINFLSNAIKFSSDGIVHLEVSARCLDGRKAAAERRWVSMDGKCIDIDMQACEPDPDANSQRRRRTDADGREGHASPPSPTHGGDMSPTNADVYGHRGAVRGCNSFAGDHGEAPFGDLELRFAVTDEGEGIPADHQARIFQLYSQVDKSHQRRTGGTGLGLVICKQLAELMGGSVGFRSQAGVGSTFWATVRAGMCDDEVASTDVRRNAFPRASPSLSRSGLQVILVDRHAGRRHLVSKALEEWARSAGAGPARCWKVAGIEDVERLHDALAQLTSVGGWVVGAKGAGAGDVTTVALWFHDHGAQPDADALATRQLSHLQRVSRMVTHLLEVHVRPCCAQPAGCHTSFGPPSPCPSSSLGSPSPFAHLFKWHDEITGPLLLPYLCAKIESQASCFRPLNLRSLARELAPAMDSPCHPPPSCPGGTAMDFVLPEYPTVSSSKCSTGGEDAGSVVTSGGVQFRAAPAAMALGGSDASSPVCFESEGGAESAASGAKGCRVLLVEDNPVNVRVATMMLARLNCCIDVATDGQAAVDRYVASCSATPTIHRRDDGEVSLATNGGCQQRSEKSSYELVFMDVQMPIMDGMEATGHIRRLEAERYLAPVPVIAMTANASSEDMQACVDAGMTGFLSKPIMLPALLSVIEQSLGRQLRCGDTRRA